MLLMKKTDFTKWRVGGYFQNSIDIAHIVVVHTISTNHKNDLLMRKSMGPICLVDIFVRDEIIGS